MDQQVLALVNALVCGAIMVICLCRLAMCHPGISALVRLKYSTLLPGAMAHGFQTFLFGDFPTPGGVVMSCAVLVGLLCSANRWRWHAPVETCIR
jgi:hypothetical protein